VSQDSGTAKSQMNTQDQLQSQQQAQENQLLQQNSAALSPYLSGNVGFTAPQLSAMNSQALDQNALRYNQAAQQTNATVAARGENGMSPMSGVAQGQYGSLNASKASDLADALRTVTLNNAQQGLTNQTNAASILSGNAQTLAGNVGTYGSGASNALSNYTQAAQNSFSAQFAKGFGSGLGSGAGAAATGGAGTVASHAGSGEYGW
jgi:hypothetical protein